MLPRPPWPRSFKPASRHSWDGDETSPRHLQQGPPHFITHRNELGWSWANTAYVAPRDAPVPASVSILTSPCGLSNTQLASAEWLMYRFAPWALADTDLSTWVSLPLLSSLLPYYSLDLSSTTTSGNLLWPLGWAKSSAISCCPWSSALNHLSQLEFDFCFLVCIYVFMVIWLTSDFSNAPWSEDRSMSISLNVVSQTWQNS